MKKNIIFSIFLISQLFVYGQVFSKEREYKVAVTLRFDDPYNSTVGRIYRGIEFAKEYFEKNNHDIKITLIKYSHGPDLKSVIDVSNQIVSSGSIAVIGGELSEEALMMADIFNQNKIVFITPTSSNPRVTADKPFVFRTCFSDDQVANDLAKFVASDLKVSAVGVLHNVSSPYSDYLSSEFLKKFQSYSENSNNTVNDYKFIKGTSNFESQVIDMKAKKIQLVSMLSHQDDLLRFAMQASRYDFHPIFIGSDGWGPTEAVYEKLVHGPQGIEQFHAYRNVYWNMGSKKGLSNDFRAKFEKKYNDKPDEWNAVGFDTGLLIFKGLERMSGKSPSDSLRQELKKFKNLPLVTNDEFTFDKNNSPSTGVVIYEVSKNGINFVKTL